MAKRIRIMALTGHQASPPSRVLAAVQSAPVSSRKAVTADSIVG
jgi:hypothetical protein